MRRLTVTGINLEHCRKQQRHNQDATHEKNYYYRVYVLQSHVIIGQPVWSGMTQLLRGVVHQTACKCSSGSKDQVTRALRHSSRLLVNSARLRSQSVVQWVRMSPCDVPGWLPRESYSAEWFWHSGCFSHAQKSTPLMQKTLLPHSPKAFYAQNSPR